MTKVVTRRCPHCEERIEIEIETNARHLPWVRSVTKDYMADAPSNLELLKRSLSVEQRKHDDMVAAGAPRMMQDHQGGRVAMLMDVVKWLEKQTGC